MYKDGIDIVNRSLIFGTQKKLSSIETVFYIRSNEVICVHEQVAKIDCDNSLYCSILGSFCNMEKIYSKESPFM